jgi:signal transduction histidine kinase
MLSFARKSDEGTYPHYLDALIDKTLELAAADYDFRKHYDFKRIEIIKEYAEDLPAVPCQGTKVQQVLLNIFGNGAQAMQAGGTQHPQFVIRTYKDSLGNRVCIEIEDNGPGMNEAARKKVFDPFFTTKPEGTGTGLGLSVSYFIITENHNGEMAVKSQPGTGAKFIIKLPMEN